MMPAANKGAGQNIGYIEVCLTPAPPAPPIPVPYIDIAFNAQVMPFSITVYISGMNGLNMSGKPMMTSGMEPGVAHPMFKMPGGYTMGNPIIWIDNQMGICLLCPTNGNNMNNPVGMVTVPSVVNVLFTALGAEAGSADIEDLDLVARMLDGDGGWLGATLEVGDDTSAPLKLTHVRRNGLAQAMGLQADDRIERLSAGDAALDPTRMLKAGERCRAEIRRPGCEELLTFEATVTESSLPNVRGTMLDETMGYIEISAFNVDTPTLVHGAISRLNASGMQSLIVDLRDNPGGDEDAFARLAEDFLSPGEFIGRSIEADGDEMSRVARHEAAYTMPLTVLINSGTASAAELFAASMKDSGRARLIGTRTYGKALARKMVPDPETGVPRWVDTHCHTRADGHAIHGVGVEPDTIVAQADLPSDEMVAIVGLRRSGLIEAYLDKQWSRHERLLVQHCLQVQPTEIEDFPEIGGLLTETSSMGLPGTTLARELRRAIHTRQAPETLLCSLADDAQLLAAVRES